MRLEEVLPYFRDGKPIYRKAWSNNKKIALCIMNGTIMCKETTNTYSYTYPLNIGDLTIKDLCETDWEVL